MSQKVMPVLVIITLLGAAYIAATMILAGDRRMLLIGKTTNAHHQLEMACETCHAKSVFTSTAAAEKALNKNCRVCHEAELKAAKDSHSRNKFRNPRMAIYWDKLDARLCTSCHIEHRPEITRKGAVTVAMDFCVACHSEGDQDIRTTRSSHADLTFDTCASAGCHNFHDNRALFEDFLVEHAGHPELSQPSVHKLSALHHARLPQTDTALEVSDAKAPAAALADSMLLQHWADSGHAAAGINCIACHAADLTEAASAAETAAHWIDEPSLAVCLDCHKPQARTFVRGRHGMRQHPKIAKPRNPGQRLRQAGLSKVVPERVVRWLQDPAMPAYMTVGEARLPMHADVDHSQAVHCGSCHRPHAVDTQWAAAQACMTCHDDLHSRSYSSSPHYALWQSELAGQTPPGSGVSCATCHMPKFERRGKITTNHNQNDNLRPNEKMIRTVCLDCHSLGFSLDALADTDLVKRNFRGKPMVHVESIDWAIRRMASGEGKSED